MKFSQVAIGQVFEYEGEQYRKTTSLVASHVESGNQKLIPRYVDLIMDDSGQTENKEPDALYSEQVVQAISSHKFKISQALQSIENLLDEERRQVLHDQVENAYHDLKASLALDSD
ncbi:MAG: hypothetical protein OQK73_00450 [Gammaproteobacteria bacterium]|nr:hypothetical protein [Gammaproteobacteria bacterium]